MFSGEILRLRREILIVLLASSTTPPTSWPIALLGLHIARILWLASALSGALTLP